MTTEEHTRLIAELESLPAYRGWWFAYEYPGLFCYHHPNSDRSVFFTPDWSVDGEMPIEVQDNEGTCVDYASIPLPHEGRTGQALFDLVKPYLDKHQLFQCTCGEDDGSEPTLPHKTWCLQATREES